MLKTITFTLAVLMLSLCVSAQQQPCQRAVAVALATSSGVHLTTDTPHMSKFLKKNSNRYPDICLSATPISGAQNFAIVISPNSNVVNGVMPVVKTVNGTSNTNGSFNGSATNLNYGSTWSFNGDYNGTTTTTSQQVVNEPYTQTDNAVSFIAYDANGVIVAQAGHVYSSRSGGDGANTLGYNLGSALGSAGARSRMYKHLFDAIEAHK